ncbi:hypothetical protein [Frankia sp. CcI49]|uniref:hypothetical protein n=1 Tax=Frankia sp. CcI49 TaxID=1745382 RepID=UPI00130449C3|nr:hypothetical protein [Frankia sp. CcI49]
MGARRMSRLDRIRIRRLRAGPRPSPRVLLALGTVVLVAGGITVGLLLAGGGSPGAGQTAGGRPATDPAATATTAARDPVGIPVVRLPTPLGNPDLSGRVLPRGNGSPSPVPPGVDGCDRNYVDASDTRTFCVPRVAPAGRTLDCDFLRDVGLAPLRVVGADTLELAGAGRQAGPGDVVCA